MDRDRSWTSAAAIAGERRTVSRKCPASSITEAFVASEGSKTKAMAVLRPKASTRNGKQVDEKPNPVRPLMKPAKAKPKVARARAEMSKVAGLMICGQGATLRAFARLSIERRP